MRQVVREFIGQRPLAPEPPQQEKAMPDDIHVRDDPQALIQSREDAYRRLAEAAEYLLRTEPHSPTPYLVKRAVAWGSMPLTELLQELVQSEGDLQQLYGLLGMRSDQ
jgi:predicted component of type VI protein secretion system